MRVVARAPVRVDFGGGWTDVPPICNEDAGRVCAAAIERYATVTLQTAGGRDAASMVPLAAAALRRAALHGVSLTISNDFPVAAGLGGSSAAGVAIQAAIAAWNGEHLAPIELVARSRAVEVEELGIAGGWQDHCAAAFGGMLDLRFGAGLPEVQTDVGRPETGTALERRSFVVYTGESRVSGETVSAVVDAWRDPRSATRERLRRMATNAGEQLAAFALGDVDGFARLVREQWLLQRALHPKIPTPRIDDIIARAAAAGSLGGKALGASGGGCVVVIAADGAEASVRAAIAPLGELLPFTIARSGVQIMSST